MKVLYATYDGLTDPLGQSQILPYIQGLVDKGFTYSILSFEKKDCFSVRGVRMKKMLDNINIEWHAFPYTKNPPVLSTLSDIRTLRKEMRRKLEKENIDLIHCRSYITMFAAFPLAKSFGVKIVFDMRGFWVDERVEGGIWKLSNPIYKWIYTYLKKKEKRYFEESDLVISLTEHGKENILKRYPKATSNNIHVIPCCADEAHFDPKRIADERKVELREDLGIAASERVICYLGSLGTWYMGEEMLTFFGQLKAKNLVDKFLILSREKEVIGKLIEQTQLDKDAVIVKACERKDVPEYLSIAQYGLFFIRNTYSKSASSPTKLGEMLLMGLPVICNKGVGDLDLFFSKQTVGWCFDLNSEYDAEAEIEKLNELKADEIRQVGLGELSLSSGILKYESALNSLR